MAEGLPDLGRPIGGAGPSEPGSPDGLVAGAGLQAAVEQRLRLVEPAVEGRDVRQAEHDAVVVGGQRGGPLELRAGQGDRVGVGLEPEEDPERLDRLGVLGEAAAEQGDGLVEPALEPEEPDEVPAGDRPVGAGAVEGRAEEVLGRREPARFLGGAGPVEQGEPGLVGVIGNGPPGGVGAVAAAEEGLGEAEQVQGLAVAGPALDEVGQQPAGGGRAAGLDGRGGLGHRVAVAAIGEAADRQGPRDQQGRRRQGDREGESAGPGLRHRWCVSVGRGAGRWCEGRIPHAGAAGRPKPAGTGRPAGAGGVSPRARRAGRGGGGGRPISTDRR